MNVELVTKEDLELLQTQIILTIETLMGESQQKKQWLRSSEVQELLNISAGTRYNLRESGELPYTTLGKIKYYKVDDIEAILEENKSSTLKSLRDEN